jgi:hypothetical protein
MKTELPSNTPPESAAVTLDTALSGAGAGSWFVPHAAIEKMAIAPAIPLSDTPFVRFMTVSSTFSVNDRPTDDFALKDPPRDRRDTNQIRNARRNFLDDHRLRAWTAPRMLLPLETSVPLLRAECGVISPPEPPGRETHPRTEARQ